MSQELCRRVECETRPPNHRERCKRIDNECPDCLCEQNSFGNGSPSPVNDEENIARFHFTPNDFLNDGSVSPAAFNEVQTHGLSVTREQADDRLVERAIALLLKNQPPTNNWQAVSIATVGAIRSIRNDDTEGTARRAFCIYDTANSSNHLHAEVCQTQHVRKRRNDLRKLFEQGRLDRQAYRGGQIDPSRSS